MTNENGGYSLSDIKAVTGNNDGMFGGNCSWFIILFLFAFLGWGNRGWGGNGGTDGGVMNNYVLTSDFSQLSRQIDSGFASQERRTDAIINGLSNGFYTEAQLINNTNMQLANGFNTVDRSILTVGNGIQGQLAQCCCDNKQAIADLKYTVAMGDNQTSQSIAMAARDIIDNQNANYRSLHDEITQNRIEDKNAQIAAQQQQIFALQLAASQANQNQYLVNQLKPCPIPAYTVPNPNCCYANTTYANSGCGCA